MKKFVFLLVSIAVSLSLSAQYYIIPQSTAGQNPGGLNTDKEYPQGGGLANGWTVIVPGSVSVDQWSAQQTIPFSFEFNGQAVTNFYASSTGVVTFSNNITTVPDKYNEALPSKQIPENSIMLWGLTPVTVSDLVSYPDVLTKVFGTAPNRQLYIFFNTYKDDGIQDGWAFWSIVLEETTNKIYFVDQRTYCRAGTSKCNGDLSLTIGIQVDSVTAYQVAGSPNVGSFNQGSAEVTDNAYYEFFPGTQPDYDLTATKITMDDFLLKNNAPYTINAEVRNLGTQTITSMDINYSINGGTAVTDQLTSLNIASLDNYTLDIPTKWNPATTGNYTIEVWASNLNGNADENKENDKFLKSVVVADKFATRIPLHEVFTSSTCPPCVQGNITLTNVLDNYSTDDYTLVKYQMSWPGSGDPYFTSEGNVRRTYYGINSVPALEVDGQWNSNPSSYSTTIYDQFKPIPSFIEITANHEVNYHTVNLDISIDPLESYSTSDLRLYAAIVENETFNNKETNGETEFYNVMKKMLPNGDGYSLTSGLTKGTKLEKSFSYKFPGDYRLPNSAQDPISLTTEHSVEEFTDLSVVVWVQNYKTKEVLQSAWSTGKIGAIDETNQGIVGMFPNPVVDFAIVRYKSDINQATKVDIYDVLGKNVYSSQVASKAGMNTLNLNLQDLDKGTYIVKLNIGDEVFTRKFVK